jgi:hypothetical protein
MLQAMIRYAKLFNIMIEMYSLNPLDICVPINADHHHALNRTLG